MVKVVMAGGGTAGHVNPLLATAAQLRDSGAEVVVLGTKAGLEADLVPAAGFPLVEIPRVPLPRRPSLAFFTLPSRFSDAVKRCEQALEGADVLVGFGGYVSTPAYIAAKRAGVPIVIHEQNARPGLANKVGARNARVVALTFPSSPLAARVGETVVTGLPLRSAIADLATRRATSEGAAQSRREAAERLGVDPEDPTLLVTGGSLGALHVNESMTGGADALPEGAQVVHLTGRGKDEPVRAAVEAAGLSDRWHVIDYLTTMEDALAVADLVVSPRWRPWGFRASTCRCRLVTVSSASTPRTTLRRVARSSSMTRISPPTLCAATSSRCWGRRVWRRWRLPRSRWGVRARLARWRIWHWHR